ncbi:RICIN domain-containing protein [Streptomyces iakyrus]|uniref:RICIN domain-containing protein n=1 Tax=Streptomyces iakyrus TaxID=68219 RepID=UPI000526789F|nr:RICIN domain-containing protein [Streptomyces iakyrus]
MRNRRTMNAVGAVLAGALLAAASPAIAQAQSPQSDDLRFLPVSSLRAADTGVLANYKSRLVLQPSGGSTASGAKVVQQPYNGNSIQFWTTVPDGNYFSWENSRSGKNLGIDGASTSAGAVAIQANGSGDLNQDWQLVYGDYPSNIFALKNRKSGLCLGISGASTSNGAQAAQFRCDGSANQGWGLAAP